MCVCAFALECAFVCMNAAYGMYQTELKAYFMPQASERLCVRVFAVSKY
jgi:hypothetical protein